MFWGTFDEILELLRMLELRLQRFSQRLSDGVAAVAEPTHRRPRA